MAQNKKNIKSSQRNTVQKCRIKDCLCHLKTHPTAELIYELVKKDLPQITLATIYRNLNQLAAEGQVLRLEINKEYHYDGDNTLHQHCVCCHCGKIIDLFQKNISDYALKNIKGFKANSVTIIFHGQCHECKQ